ncbi:MAG: hypothetical protein RI935_404 [Candidatus Parcubacteria bacterium]
MLPTSVQKRLLPLYYIGLALYWGEGTKSGTTLVFTNSDPDMMLLFVTFLRVICKIDEQRIKCLLHIHEGQKDKKLKDFLVKKLSIPVSSFYKTTIHKKGKSDSTKKLEFGTISLRYYDASLLESIMQHINNIKSQNSSVGRATVL